MAVNGVDATYYTAINVESLADFYEKLLGAPSFRQERIAEWTLGDGSAFGLYQADGKTGGRSGSIMFAVDDVAAAMDAAKAAGARLADDDLTETPVCTMGFAYDPEGNQFILHKHKQ